MQYNKTPSQKSRFAKKTVNGSRAVRSCPRQSMVQRHVIGKIKSGHYTDRLPGIAVLAKKLRVNTRTVQKALSTLVEQEYLYQIPRSGTFVRSATHQFNHAKNRIQWTKVLNVGVSQGFEITPQFCQVLDKALGSKRAKVNLVDLGQTFQEYVSAVERSCRVGPFLDAVLTAPLWLDMVSRHLVPLEELAPELTAQTLETLVPTVSEAFRIHDKQLALPLVFSPSLWLINEELCARAGIEPPTRRWNWRDFSRTCEALSRVSGTYGACLNNSNEIFAPFILQNEGQFYDRETGRYPVNEPSSLEALDFILGMIHRKKTALGVLPANTSVMQLFERQVLGMVSVTYYPCHVMGAPFRHRRVTPPSLKRQATFGFATGIGIFRGCRAPEQALDLVMTLVNETAQLEFAVSRCALPSRQDILHKVRLAAMVPGEVDAIIQACANIHFGSLGANLPVLQSLIKEMDLLWLGVIDLDNFARRVQEICTPDQIYHK